MKTTKQPNGLYILFFAELWERYSFYTMQTLLVLFLIKNFSFTDSQAYVLYGSFSALIYLTPILGGYIADRFIGYRMSIYIGAVFYILGLFLLALLGKQVFYSSLGFLIIGNGFFKSNVSTLLGTLYEKNDIRRDSGFTLFYLGINLGSLLASFLSAYFATEHGWYFAFGVAGIGMSIGLITCLKTFSRLGNHGLAPSFGNSRYYISIGAFLCVFLFSALLQAPTLLNWLYYTSIIIVLMMIFFMIMRQKKHEQYKVIALFLFILFSILFWALYSQIFSLITLFTERNVDRALWIWTIPASAFVGLNSIFILMFSPLFAWLWLYLAKKNHGLSYAHKFALGLLFIGLSFLILKLSVFLNHNGVVNLLWIVAAYFLLTVGELSLSPIGLSVFSALAPQNIKAMIMGIWFLSLSMGFALGSKLSMLAAIPHDVSNLVEVANIYGKNFMLYAILGIGASMIVALTAPWIKKLTTE